MSTTKHPPWDRWYGLTVWLKRRRHQLMVEPFCRTCAAKGLSVVATEVDHIEPHRGDWNKFRLGAVQSLCKPCHDRKRYTEAHGFDRAIGIDGMPIDRSHPCYGRDDEAEPAPAAKLLVG